ncbi:hypothetical protein [Nocardia sp. NPDC005825]|uniref:hypothetical protein n=1 Tax=unclassified Nocardia TaxID=2637762 RepID=UPI003411DC75
METSVTEVVKETGAGNVWVYRFEVGEGDWLVLGLSCEPTIMSRVWLWEPKFEQALSGCVAGIAPAAEIVLHVYDIDEERAHPGTATAMRRKLISALPKGDARRFFK